MAADSTMLRMVKRLMALSLGVHREQLLHRMGLTWPRPFLFRPLEVNHVSIDLEKDRCEGARDFSSRGIGVGSASWSLRVWRGIVLVLSLLDHFDGICYGLIHDRKKEEERKTRRRTGCALWFGGCKDRRDSFLAWSTLRASPHDSRAPLFPPAPKFPIFTGRAGPSRKTLGQLTPLLPATGEFSERAPLHQKALLFIHAPSEDCLGRQ